MKLRIAHHPIKTLVLATLLIGSLVGIVSWQAFKNTSHAADIRNFDPGNIMSDSVMSDKSTMSVQDIQNFLNSKNYCDNRNVHMAAWYPNLQYNIKDGKFVCMARDTFDGQSAAQIIWQAAQDYSINPQFLLVLLEKEQGLITDTWPNHIQYRSATGFGCPDTDVCDSKYYGLKNQIRNAAALFRTVLNGGWSNYPVGQTYVQYHPNANCGGSVINIQNRATSALYRYTPYQPNKSALEAGYGTGDSCGAYGNRNTWRLFTDWFGSTQGNPSFEKMETSRYLTPKQSGIRKINLITYQETDAPLSKGQVIYFTGRTLYNGSWCLRTEFDRDNNNYYCIPLNSLEEIRINYTETPKTLIEVVDPSAIKTDPLTKSTLDVLRKNQILTVSQSFTFNGVDYYRSIHDVNTASRYGIRKSNVRIIPIDISPIDDVNLTVKTPDLPHKTNVWSLSPATNLQPLRFGQTITFSAKATIDGSPYYISKLDYNGQDSIYAINSKYLNTQHYTQLMPRKDMLVTRKTCKHNLDNNMTTNLCYETGTILSFSSITQSSDETWYRTTWETNYNTNLVINLEDLKSL